MTIRKPTALSWLWLSALTIFIDQLSKHWVLTNTQPGAEIPVIHGFLYRTLVFNRGAAFSFLANGDGWQRWFFIILTIVICVALIVWLLRTARRDWRTALPVALIIGGAIGNLIDRIDAGKVTDFILVFFGHWAYPSFNFADSCICVGAVLLIFFGLFGGKTPDAMR